MKNKIAVIWVSGLALMLAVLFVMSVLAKREGYANLLMVTPKTPGTQGIDTEKLEEFSEEEFLLTYAVRRPVTAQAVNSRHSVVIVETNHNYAGIMGYVPLDGGFFTKAAMDSKSRHVVLNETAAFRMFGSNNITGGSLKLNGDTWIVTGVIQDNDTENINLYVPASLTGGRADTIMVLTDKTVTEAYAKNALKSIGIHDNGYDFINLSESAAAFGERFSVAWKAALSAAILLFIIKAGDRMLEGLRFYRNSLREVYLRELLVRYRKDLLKTTGELLAFVTGIAAMLILSLQILETCLAWQGLGPITGELTAGDFGQKLLWLRDYQIFSYILFWGCICLVILGLAVALFRRHRRLKYRHTEHYPI